MHLQQLSAMQTTSILSVDARTNLTKEEIYRFLDGHAAGKQIWIVETHAMQKQEHELRRRLIIQKWILLKVKPQAINFFN